ncbi:MAG: hypothetical protein H7246_01865 [Phycisphaerae bacterium]|nr:hypothetical protein [Saprospiraceae bacterium]
MKIQFDPALKANLSLDHSNVVRDINHFEEFYLSESEVPRVSAIEYLGRVSKIVGIPEQQLENAHQLVSYLEPFEQGLEYRLSEEKTFFDSTTLGFYQTFLNVPVWRAGLTVTVKHGPNRVVSMCNTSQEGVEAKLPDEKTIEQFKSLFATGFQSKEALKYREAVGVAETSTEVSLNEILGIKLSKKAKPDRHNIKGSDEKAKIIRGRFYVYRYDSKKRQAEQHNDEHKESGFQEHTPTLPLPRMDERIKDGQYYVVAEVTFSFGHFNWLMLIELETKSVLYLEALSSNLNGQVFLKDPVSKTGVTSNTAVKPNAVLNLLRDTVVLPNLDAPVGGVQSLKGRFANLTDVEDPIVAPPTKPSGSDFNFDVRTNDFAAVNAYYHVDRFFAMVESLGFPIANYFNNTNFPISVDHRGHYVSTNGIEIGAHCEGNGMGGIGFASFSLADNVIDTITNPIGIALDNIVVLHELGGHGILYEHIGSANFGFAHSAGDSIGAINNDPDSQVRGTLDRFMLTPWVRFRRFDKAVGSGWAWGGSKDIYGYQSEEILATTLFRVYRSIGGDSVDLNRRRFAAEMMTYLILRTISTLTPMSNPSTALAFCNAMMATDLLDWTSRGISGSAYNKVVRWSFEKQGLFQPVGTPSPFTSAGAAPDVDVYIEDGRNGEYGFQPVHWNCQSIWNRRAADGIDTHQEPILGATNFAYVKVKNRGGQIANNVTVRGFHCLPGAGLTWPNDFEEMTYTGTAIGTLNPNSTQEKTVGPFEWLPNKNVYGHDCMMMIASATGDPSNIANFTIGETIEEWRLVPNDNNIAQRNVNLVPAGGGFRGLVAGLDRKIFFVGNPIRKPALMKITIELPALLKEKNWGISFQDLPNNEFKLKPGERRELVINLKAGADFTKNDVLLTNDREIVISVYADEALIGGMTYYLDENLKFPINDPDGKGDATKCADKAKELLDCLKIPNQEVKSVKVRKITVDIEMNTGDC